MEQVGVIKVLPGATIRRTYETAAWFTDYAIEPGIYPVYKGGYHGSIYADVHGTITAEYMGTLYGGVHVGGPYEAPVGKSGRVVWYGAFYNDQVHGETEFIKFSPTNG